MKKIDRRISRFLRRHRLLTVATTNGTSVWVAHCFYVWVPHMGILVVASDKSSQHAQNWLQDRQVALGVGKETRRVGILRGAQISGEVFLADEEEKVNASKYYYGRFPYARALDATLWVIRLNSIKYTDNRLGFGKKLYWDRGIE